MHTLLAVISMCTALFSASGASADEIPLSAPTGDFQACHDRWEQEQMNRCAEEMVRKASLLNLTVALHLESRTNTRGEPFILSIGTFSNKSVCECTNPNFVNCH